MKITEKQFNLNNFNFSKKQKEILDAWQKEIELGLYEHKLEKIILSTVFQEFPKTLDEINLKKLIKILITLNEDLIFEQCNLYIDKYSGYTTSYQYSVKRGNLEDVVILYNLLNSEKIISVSITQLKNIGTSSFLKEKHNRQVYIRKATKSGFSKFDFKFNNGKNLRLEEIDKISMLKFKDYVKIN